MIRKNAPFHLFRYQILPRERHFHGDLFNGITSVNELIGQKNRFFGEALESIDNFYSSNTEITTKCLFAEDDFYLYQIGANRSLRRETKDFSAEKLDNWPSILVAIWNDPEKQFIAIQNRSIAFQKSDTVAKFVLNDVSRKLQDKYLSVLFEPLFEKKVFWDLVNHNNRRITSVEFEIITPNMANISGSLKDDLKSFAKASNSTKNKLAIESAPGAPLELNDDNETLVGLVDYSSQGGGNITLKIAGMNKKIKTSRTVKEVNLTDFQLGGPPEEVAAILKNILP